MRVRQYSLVGAPKTIAGGFDLRAKRRSTACSRQVPGQGKRFARDARLHEMPGVDESASGRIATTKMEKNGIVSNII